MQTNSVDGARQTGFVHQSRPSQLQHRFTRRPIAVAYCCLQKREGQGQGSGAVRVEIIQDDIG